MSLWARRATYYGTFVGLMVLTTSSAFDDAMRSLFGDGIGGDQSSFWKLQVESYFVAVMIPPVLDFVYHLRRGPNGWTARDPGARLRTATYAVFVVVTLIFSAERPVRRALDVALPNDIAFSLAHYLRHGLEAPITVLLILLFLDLVLQLGRGQADAAGAATAGS